MDKWVRVRRTEQIKCIEIPSSVLLSLHRRSRDGIIMEVCDVVHDVASMYPE